MVTKKRTTKKTSKKSITKSTKRSTKRSTRKKTRKERVDKLNKKLNFEFEKREIDILMKLDDETFDKAETLYKTNDLKVGKDGKSSKKQFRKVSNLTLKALNDIVDSKVKLVDAYCNGNKKGVVGVLFDMAAKQYPKIGLLVIADTLERILEAHKLSRSLVKSNVITEGHVREQVDTIMSLDYNTLERFKSLATNIPEEVIEVNGWMEVDKFNENKKSSRPISSKHYTGGFSSEHSSASPIASPVSELFDDSDVNKELAVYIKSQDALKKVTKYEDMIAEATKEYWKAKRKLILLTKVISTVYKGIENEEIPSSVNMPTNEEVNNVIIDILKEEVESSIDSKPYRSNSNKVL